MSVIEGIFYLALLLLAPLALISLMVLGIVKLTEADKKRFQRNLAIQKAAPEFARSQPERDELLLEAHFSRGMNLWLC